MLTLLYHLLNHILNCRRVTGIAKRRLCSSVASHDIFSSLDFSCLLDFNRRQMLSSACSTPSPLSLSRPPRGQTLVTLSLLAVICFISEPTKGRLAAKKQTALASLRARRSSGPAVSCNLGLFEELAASWSWRHSVHSTCPQCLSGTTHTLGPPEGGLSHHTHGSVNRNRFEN